MNPARAERRAKALGLALVGSMFVVALVVHSWPARRAPLLSAAIRVPGAGLAPVSSGLVSTVPEPAPDPAPSAAIAAPVVARAAPSTAMLDAHPIVARVQPVVASDSRVAVAAPTVLDAAPLVAIAALPDAPGQPITVAEADADAPWDAMAHAGVALGRAFRNAGVKTAGAFVRIF